MLGAIQRVIEAKKAGDSSEIACNGSSLSRDPKTSGSLESVLDEYCQKALPL